MSEVFDVVIVGGGPVGLALAAALGQGLQGEARIAVIGGARPIDPAGDPRAVAIAGGSMALLRSLGVWPRIEHEAEPVVGIDITDSSLDAGVRPVVLSYENVLDDGTAATAIVPLALVHGALHEVARSTAGVVLLDGSLALVHFDDLAARLTLDDGRIVSARLAVGADGRRSRLREAAGIGIVERDYRQVGIVTVVAHELPHRGRAVQHFLPSGPFAMLPMKGDRSCITWTETADEGRRILALDDAAFLAEVDRRFGGRLGDLTLAGGRRSWPLAMHLSRAYVANRLALAGDAAHGVHPIAGQGLNLGFRDVAALAEVIADTARLGLDVGLTTTLQRYERRRRADSALSAGVFDRLQWLFANDNPALRAVRDSGMAVVDRLPALKRFLVAEAAGLTGEVPRLLRGEPL
ncbi:MAG: FAD-dependent monooxygenase [Hyphomicrobiales bacterium]|nr:FAD-dependent monooxygenase [Hyphomicrobiales bacterium]